MTERVPAGPCILSRGTNGISMDHTFSQVPDQWKSWKSADFAPNAAQDSEGFFDVTGDPYLEKPVRRDATPKNAEIIKARDRT